MKRTSLRPRWGQRTLAYLHLLRVGSVAPWATHRERLRQIRVTATIGLLVGPIFAAFNLLTPGMTALGTIE